MQLVPRVHCKVEVHEKNEDDPMIHLLLGFNFQLELLLQVLNPGVSLVQLSLDSLHDLQLVSERGELQLQTGPGWRLPTRYCFVTVRALLALTSTDSHSLHKLLTSTSYLLPLPPDLENLNQQRAK